MEFLKEVLGEELYSKFEQAINAYNGNEANKDKQVKLANLATGEYVGKGKFDGLNEQLTGKQTELDKANDLIATLKKSTKDNADLQTKFTDYESQVQSLQAQLKQAKLESAIKVALLEAKATDIDYMTFKLKEKGELELDENEKIKGWDDKISSLKTQFPNQFEGSTQKKIDENKLKDGDDSRGVTKKEILKMSYAERAQLFQENPEGFSDAMKNN